MKQPSPVPDRPRALRSIAPLLAVGLFLWLVAGPDAPRHGEEVRPASGDVSPGSDLVSKEQIPAERVPARTLEGAEQEPHLTDLLFEAHRSFHARDSEALSDALEAVLIDPHRSTEVLDGLATNRWAEADQPLSPAEDGARLVVGAGCALYLSDRSPTDAAFGDSFLTHALVSLIEIREGLARVIAAELARARVEEVRVLGARWLPHLLHLRWKHPQRRAVYDLLLEAACADEEADGALLARLLLSGEEDPGLLRIMLGRLLLEDPTHWMAVTRDWFDRAGSRETRAALASAVAVSAPLEEAAGFLADAADAELFAQITTLAGRDGALEELADEYEERLLTEDDPLGRRALVVGLIREPDLCLGIARTDPDAGVRGQALLSATAAGVSEEALDILRAAWQSGEDPYYGVAPRHLVWASANAALHASPDLRPVAVDLLRSLAADPTFPGSVRWDACDRLERWLPDADHAALEAELSLSLPQMSIDPVTQETP